MKIAVFWLLGMVLLIGAVSYTVGCQPAHAAVKPPTTVPALTHPGQTPVALKHVAVGLDWIIVTAVVAVGVGIGLFFFLPASHNLSLALLGIGGGVEGSALVTRVSLWAVPWVALGLAILAVVVFGYEVYRNRAKVDAEFNEIWGKWARPFDSSTVAEVKSSTVTPIPVQIVHP